MSTGQDLFPSTSRGIVEVEDHIITSWRRVRPTGSKVHYNIVPRRRIIGRCRHLSLLNSGNIVPNNRVVGRWIRTNNTDYISTNSGKSEITSAVADTNLN